jgi:hypothetical protein
MLKKYWQIHLGMKFFKRNFKSKLHPRVVWENKAKFLGMSLSGVFYYRDQNLKPSELHIFRLIYGF